MLHGNYPFEFAGVSSEDFGDGLVIWYLSDVGGQYEEPLYTVDVVETRLPIRHDPLFHTVTDNNKAITREIQFGSDTYLDRETVDQITVWLTNQVGYQPLVIFDDDELADYKYYCIFQDVRLVSNSKPYGFTATLVMMDQFAHEDPTTTSYQIEDGKVITSSGLVKDTVKFNNESSLFDYAYPKVTLKIPVGIDEFSIVNLDDKDGNRPFVFRNLSTLATTDGSTTLIIEVDNKNRIITSPNISNTRALYECFGNSDEYYHFFFRLLNGDNELQFNGTGMVSITHENLRKVGM